MEQQALITRITEALNPDPRIRALFLSGSFGTGTNDAYSDVDLLAVLEAEHHQAFAEDWKRILGGIAPVVYWNTLPHALVVNAITEDWTRCDIEIAVPDPFPRKAQNQVRPLIDRDDLYPRLPREAQFVPRPERIAYAINDFIRIMGLLVLAMGREEYLTGVTGVQLLRQYIIDLMIIEHKYPDPGGILHLNRLLDDKQKQDLSTLAVPSPTRPSIIAAHLSAARVFFPRARALAEEYGLEWPSVFEAATRHNLARHLGPDAPLDW
jgi:hypothetical protein